MNFNHISFLVPDSGLLLTFYCICAGYQCKATLQYSAKQDNSIYIHGIIWQFPTVLQINSIAVGCSVFQIRWEMSPYYYYSWNQCFKYYFSLLLSKKIWKNINKKYWQVSSSSGSSSPSQPIHNKRSFW